MHFLKKNGFSYLTRIKKEKHDLDYYFFDLYEKIKLVEDNPTYQELLSTLFDKIIDDKDGILNIPSINNLKFIPGIVWSLKTLKILQVNGLEITEISENINQLINLEELYIKNVIITQNIISIESIK